MGTAIGLFFLVCLGQSYKYIQKKRPDFCDSDFIELTTLLLTVSCLVFPRW